MRSAEELVLCLLAPDPFNRFKIGHLQKMTYLAQRALGDTCAPSGASFLEHENGSFGPSSSALGPVLRAMIATGSLRRDIDQDERSGLEEYSLTRSGYEKGTSLLDALPADAGRYVRELNAWAAKQGFVQIIAATVRNYPETGENLLFRQRPAAAALVA